MKKTIFALSLVLCLAGCTKEQNTAVEPTACKVHFTLGSVSSGPITKGEVPDLLAAHAPSGQVTISLVSLNDNSRSYSAVPGEEITIIPDTYKVTGDYIPASCFDCFRGKFYLEPRFSINTQVTISEEETAYSLPVSWDCFALVKDKTKVAKYRVTDKNITPADVTTWTEDEGDLSLVFVTCSSAWEGDMYFQVKAFPVDETNYQPTTWNLVTKATTGAFLVKNGYWYCFNPEGTTAQNGEFSFSYPSWTEGDTSNTNQ